MKLNLPNNFIWGTATAAHQVEGACAGICVHDQQSPDMDSQGI